MRESEFQRRCLRWVADAYGGRVLAVNIHGGGATAKGFPDLLVLGKGRAAAFELKGASGYGLQPDQELWRRRFLRAGTPHHVVRDDLDEFKDTVRREFGNEAEEEIRG